MKLARILIAGLIVFEFLNLFGVLHFTLNFSWLGLIITALGVFIVTETIYYLCKKHNSTPPIFLYYLITFVLFMDVVGDINYFYATYSWYDQLAHFLCGAVAMTVIMTIFLQFKQRHTFPLIVFIIICLSGVALLGNLYELEEYLEDKFHHRQQFRLGDGPDTANDIMLNLIGGTVVGGLYYLKQKNNTTKKQGF